MRMPCVRLCLAFLVLLLASPTFPAESEVPAPASSKSILAVFAHPDDDITIGPLLAHYARQGVHTYLAVVTSGQHGVTPHAHIPAGPQLGAAREAESRCACKAYGIEEPFLLGEQDGSLASMQHHDQIIARLVGIIEKVKPSVVITFGPDGLTGHTDHRAVSNMVTEMLQMFKVYQPTGYAPRKLYYVAYPQSLFGKTVPPFPGLLASVNDSFITSVVDSRDGLAAAAQAEECYKTQHTPEIMKGLSGMMANVLKGQVYLRQAFCPPGQRMVLEEDILQNPR
jgi:LmbE family N-acetylglucosaminyl deacetylase